MSDLSRPSIENMEGKNNEKTSMVGFFKAKGYDDICVQEMFRRCRRLEIIQQKQADENWNYLKGIGVEERKLRHAVVKCPKILTLELNEKIVPMVQCLATLSKKPQEVATAIMRFPNIVSHSIEEKLCPLLAFFQALGISELQVGKMLLVNPRLISYSIDTKLSRIISFFTSSGLNEGGMIAKILAKNSSIMGYNVEKRLRPTLGFLKSSVGLGSADLQRVVVNFPEILCRDVDKVLTPNFAFLKSCGFNSEQIVVLVTGYPPVLIKSVKTSLEPRMKFLVDVMGRDIGEVVAYPQFFRHGLKKSIEFRQRILKQNCIQCSLSEMLDCKQNKFIEKFGVVEAIS